MSIDLNALGFTKEELQERVVNACVDRLLESTSLTEDGDEFVTSSPIARRLETSIKAMIDAKVSELAEKHVLPLTSTFIENLTLQQTNQWGEKTGKAVTFIEYLVARAEAYLREDVNYDGKARNESNSCGWSKSQTRITYLVNQHLHYAIENAMKQAMAQANSVIAGGIEETVKHKLAELTKSLSVQVSQKR